MAKIVIVLDETWVFLPLGREGRFADYLVDQEVEDLFEQGKEIEVSDYFLERYRQVSEEFYQINDELEELYRDHFMNK